MSVNPGEEIEELVLFAKDVIQRAGNKALEFYGKRQSGMKFDQTLVTEAELHLITLFQDEVRSRYSDHHIFVSDQLETGYSHEGKRYLWIFDPIDGADNFQTGIPIWGMSVALLENFWPVLGLFHMPTTGDLFHAVAGSSAYRGKHPIGVNDAETVDDESILLTYSRFHQSFSTGFPGKIRNLGCTAVHICYVAMGRADAAVVANESFRDLAASRVIIESAGGKLFKLDGTDFFLNEYLDGDKIGEPLIATSPDKLGAVLDCIKQTR